MFERREVIQDVLEAFVGMDAKDDLIGTVLDADEIEILTKAIDEALGEVNNENKD